MVLCSNLFFLSSIIQQNQPDREGVRRGVCQEVASCEGVCEEASLFGRWERRIPRKLYEEAQVGVGELHFAMCTVRAVGGNLA